MTTDHSTPIDQVTDASAALIGLIQSGEARVGVIGQGYVGLPLAMTMASAGLDVTGYDIDQRKIDSLVAGKSYIDDVSDKVLQERLQSGRFHPRASFDDLSEMDAISICVPTPLSKTRDPDISFILTAAREVAERLRPGQLIVLESTTYPGSTDELLLPVFEEKGLVVGEDFFLCFSPERVDPGNLSFDIRNTPRLVGGITDSCTAVGCALYNTFLTTVVPMSSTRAAEMAKLLENTFRAVNIGLVNEVALMCRKLGLDTWEVIDAAATKPFGFMKFYPGPGLGGHCIPVDPHYLSWILKTLNYRARFIELAAEVNTSMPAHVVELVSESLNEDSKSVRGSRVLILGVSYKANVSDTRESPALDVIQLLIARGAEIRYHDPHVPHLELVSGEQLASESLGEEMLSSFDCVVVTSDHAAIDWELVARKSVAIVDCRNALAGVDSPVGRIHKL